MLVTKTKSPIDILLRLGVFAACGTMIAYAGTPQEQFVVNSSPIQLLTCDKDPVANAGQPPNKWKGANQDPFNSGTLNDNDFQALIDYDDVQLTNSTASLRPCVASSKNAKTKGNANPPDSFFVREDQSNHPQNLTFTASADKGRATVIHILKWADDQHQNVAFQQWYVYDPNRVNAWTYLRAGASAYEAGTYIDGRKSFRLIVVHMDSEFKQTAPNSKTESFDGASPAKLNFNVQYKVTITKAQTQLQQDIVSLAEILGYYTAPTAPGGPGAGFAPPAQPYEIGYFEVYDFNSALSTSSIAFSAILPSSAPAPKDGGAAGAPTPKDGGVAGAPGAGRTKPPANNPNSPSAAQQKPAAAATNKSATDNAKQSPSQSNGGSSQTYHNEAPSWFELGVAVPVTSYRDLSFSNGAVAPQTITRTNVYVTGNLFLPRTEVGWSTIRWVPHPFGGLPIKGQPWRNSITGVSMGWRYFEPFFGIVWDVEQIKGASGTAENHLVRKGVYGINISVSALSKALAGK